MYELLSQSIILCFPSHVSYLPSDCHDTTVVLNTPGFVSANNMSQEIQYG